MKIIEDRMELSDKSQIQRHFHDRSLLKHFQELRLKDRIFTGVHEEFSSSDEGTEIELRCRSPPRKRQKSNDNDI